MYYELAQQSLYSLNHTCASNTLGNNTTGSQGKLWARFERAVLHATPAHHLWQWPWHSFAELHCCYVRASPVAVIVCSLNILTARSGPGTAPQPLRAAAQAPRAGRARDPWSCTQHVGVRDIYLYLPTNTVARCSSLSRRANIKREKE